MQSIVQVFLNIDYSPTCDDFINSIIIGKRKATVPQDYMNPPNCCVQHPSCFPPGRKYRRNVTRTEHNFSFRTKLYFSPFSMVDLACIFYLLPSLSLFFLLFIRRLRVPTFCEVAERHQIFKIALLASSE